MPSDQRRLRARDRIEPVAAGWFLEQQCPELPIREPQQEQSDESQQQQRFSMCVGALSARLPWPDWRHRCAAATVAMAEPRALGRCLGVTSPQDQIRGGGRRLVGRTTERLRLSLPPTRWSAQTSFGRITSGMSERPKTPSPTIDRASWRLDRTAKFPRYMPFGLVQKIEAIARHQQNGKLFRLETDKVEYRTNQMMNGYRIADKE
jgi:hypothetical protein